MKGLIQAVKIDQQKKWMQKVDLGSKLERYRRNNGDDESTSKWRSKQQTF
jgi:hypothetical protein